MPRNNTSSFDILPQQGNRNQPLGPRPKVYGSPKQPIPVAIPAQLPQLRTNQPRRVSEFTTPKSHEYRYYRTAVAAAPVRTVEAMPEPARANKKSWLSVVAVAAVFIMVGFAGFKVTFGSDNQSGDASRATIQGIETASAESISESAVETEPVQTVDADATLKPLVDELSAANPSVNIGVAMVDLKSGKQYVYGLDTGFVAASTTKLITAAAYYHEVETGKRSLDTKLNGVTGEQLIKQLITVSDNDAWARLNKAITLKQLKAYAIENELTDYNPNTNTINPKDIAVLLQKLYDNKLLNEMHTKQMLEYMKEANYTNYIPKAVPEGVAVYHKAGWLDDRVHDVAIIDDGTNSYVLVILTKMKAGYDPDVGLDIFHQITKASLEVFLNRS